VTFGTLTGSTCERVKLGCTEFLRSGDLLTIYLFISLSVKYWVTFVSNIDCKGDLTSFSALLNVTLAVVISGSSNAVLLFLRISIVEIIRWFD
jgi:hypothetical protein